MRRHHARKCTRTLPIPLPECPLQRSALFIIRRTAIGGNQDAHAAMLAVHAFGVRFRKPLALLRCLVHELAQTSDRTIQIAPFCSGGMTRDEGMIHATITGGGIAPLLALTDNEACESLLPITEMLAGEFGMMRLSA